MSKDTTQFPKGRVRANLIRNKAVRSLIARNLRDYHVVLRTILKNTDESLPRRPVLNDIDLAGHAIQYRRTSTKREVQKEFEHELNISYLGIIVCFVLGEAVGCLNLGEEQKPHDNCPLPHDWISSDGKPDPNFILQLLLHQIVNYSSAHVSLIEIGLQNPACSLFRSLIELCWLLLVVTADQRKMKAYARGVQEETARGIWEKDFAPGKLLAALYHLEESLGFPKDVKGELGKARTSAHEHYSRVAHHSYLATTAGAFERPLNGDGETIILATFGVAGLGAKAGLLAFNLQLFYTLRIFFSLIHKTHNYLPPTSDRWWIAAESLFDCFEMLVLHHEAQEFASEQRKIIQEKQKFPGPKKDLELTQNFTRMKSLLLGMLDDLLTQRSRLQQLKQVGRTQQYILERWVDDLSALMHCQEAIQKLEQTLESSSLLRSNPDFLLSMSRFLATSMSISK